MNHINRLLVQLRREHKPLIHSAMCIIERVKGKWIADPTFWDGKPLSGHMEGVIPSDWIREYDTADEAAEAVERLFDALEIAKKPVILIDDLSE